MTTVAAEKYQLWPFVKLDDGSYSIPDILLNTVYLDLLKEERVDATFYGGCIKEFEDFLSFVKDPTNYFVFVVDAENRSFVCIAWLNGVMNNSAFSHFTSIGRNSYKPQIGKLVLDYWKATGVPTVLVGITPETHKLAIRLAVNLGYKTLGVIPNLCYVERDKKSVGGIISYYLFGGDKNGEC